MPMPETTMHENDAFQPWKDEVGAAGQFASMQPETKSKLVDKSPHDQFRRRILAPDATHPAASLDCGQAVDHSPLPGKPRYFSLRA
jgi:hypothetical protein